MKETLKAVFSLHPSVMPRGRTLGFAQLCEKFLHMLLLLNNRHYFPLHVKILDIRDSEDYKTILSKNQYQMQGQCSFPSTKFPVLRPGTQRT